MEDDDSAMWGHSRNYLFLTFVRTISKSFVESLDMESLRPNIPSWQPTRLIRVEKSFATSTGATKIKTDATFGIIKTMGNREGSHALACELVGSTLARWFGLTVPDFAILPLPEEACFELPHKAMTQAGPAFVSRFRPGGTWHGSETELKMLENPEDITRLVVFDTWVRNGDRHPPDLTKRNPNYANVYLANTKSSSRLRLLAIDHTHCFDSSPVLSRRLADIGNIKDDRTFGLFPAFRPMIDEVQLIWCRAALREIKREDVERIVAMIPPEWEVDGASRESLVRQIHERAGFVADRIDLGWPLRMVAND